MRRLGSGPLNLDWNRPPMSASGQPPRLAFAFDPTAAAGVLTPACLERLAACCSIVDQWPLTSFGTEPAGGVLADIDILLTGWGCPRIDASVLSHAPRLRLVAHSAGSIRSIVAPEVFTRGIAVVNAAAANAVPVAEYTLAAILFANKQVLHFRHLYREHHRPRPRAELADPGIGNYRRTVGIVGASRIGRRVVELLRPFDFDVQLFDPHLDEDDAARLGVRAVPLDALMASSDVVSLHAPSLETTRHMIDARRLALMRDGTTLINTARGALVDQAALERELVTGRLNAVIDVTVPEVLPETSPLYTLPNVLLTPHIAGALGNERERLGLLVTEEIERFVRGEPLRYALAADALDLQA